MTDYITPNAAEMQLRRGRPPKLVAASEAPTVADEPKANPVAVAKPAMTETLIPLILKCGYFPAPGVAFTNADGEDEIFPDFAPDQAGERNRRKLKPGTKIRLPIRQAKVLLDAGKADLDAGL